MIINGREVRVRLERREWVWTLLWTRDKHDRESVTPGVLVHSFSYLITWAPCSPESLSHSSAKVRFSFTLHQHPSFLLHVTQHKQNHLSYVDILPRGMVSVRAGLCPSHWSICTAWNKVGAQKKKKNPLTMGIILEPPSVSPAQWFSSLRSIVQLQKLMF